MSQGVTNQESCKSAVDKANSRVRELESALAAVTEECEGLRSSEALHKAQYQGLPIPTYTWQSSGDDLVLVDHNQAAAAFTGGAVARFVGSTATEMYGSDAPDLLADLSQCLKGQKRIRREITCRFVPSGEVKHLMATFVPLSPDLVMVHAEDITERDQIESLLRVKDWAIEASVTATALSDVSGNLTYVNRAFLNLWQYSKKDQVLGQPTVSFWEDPKAAGGVIVQLKDKGAWQGELTGKRPDGSTFDCEVLASMVLDENGEPLCMMASFSDISARKRTEAELVRLERLRALEEMGSGVAHNFNNLLVGVLGYAQLIQMRSEEVETRKFVESIVESALRGKALVERLNGALQTGRQERVQGVDIQEIVDGVLDTYRPLWKDEAEAKGVQIQVSVAVADVPPVSGNPGGLRDIVTNLVLNAVDALPRGGSIDVRAEQSGQMVCLTVADNGVGMDEETRKRVFDPFFTSKADIGTGLGLSVAHTTAIRWGGRASVASSPGEGTTFTFYLPIWEGPEREAEVVEAEVVDTGATLRLMVVDDDVTIRSFMLDALGTEFEVSVYDNGRSALAAVEPGRFDVALIDLGMPGIPGDQVAARIRELDPCVVCVLITGWALGDEDPRLNVFDFRMTKPFMDLKQSIDLIRKAGSVHRTRVKEQEDVGG